jgi:hypothetical protein
MLFVEIYVCSIVYRRTCAFLYFLFIKEYLRRDPLKFGSNFCLIFSFDLQFLAETKQFLDPPQSETLIRTRNFFTNQSFYSVQNMNSPSQHRYAHSVMMIKWSVPVHVGSATYNYSASRVTGTDLPLSDCLSGCVSVFFAQQFWFPDFSPAWIFLPYRASWSTVKYGFNGTVVEFSPITRSTRVRFPDAKKNIFFHCFIRSLTMTLFGARVRFLARTT